MNNIITRKKYKELKLKTEKLKAGLEAFLDSVYTDKDSLPAGKLIEAIKDYRSAAAGLPEYKITAYEPSAEDNIDSVISDELSGRKDILDILYSLSAEKISCLTTGDTKEDKVTFLLHNGFIMQIKISSPYLSDSFYMLTEKGRKFIADDKGGASEILPEYVRNLPQEWNDSAFCRAAIINRYFTPEGKKYIMFCDPYAPQLPVGISIDSAEKTEYAVAGIFDTVDAEQEILFLKQLCSQCRNKLTLVVVSEQDRKELEHEWGLDTGDLPKLHWHQMEVENG